MKTTNKSLAAPALSVIEAAKADENQNSLILLMHDLNAMKIIEGWRLTKPVFVDRPLRKGERIDQALEEVWQGCEADLSGVSDKIGVSLNVVVGVFNRLKKARLIYPDGTAHRGATAIISNEVMVYLKSFLRP